MTSRGASHDENRISRRKSQYGTRAFDVRLTSTADDALISQILDRTEQLSPMLVSIDSHCERVRIFEVC